MGEAAELLEVRLLGMPLDLRSQFVRHGEGLLREFSLVRIGAVIDAALAAGEDSCDVTCAVPAGLGPSQQRLAELLEQADDSCRREQHLLTLPAPPEVVAHRDWIFGEFRRQLAGGAARPWSRPSAVPAQPAETTRGGPRAGGGAAGGGEVVGRALVMESVASSVALSRRHVRRVVREMGAEAVEESAELGVCELVTNAMLHARTVFTVTVRAMPTGRVRVEVTDSSPRPLQPRRFGVVATTGRGLQLVASVSSDWGIEELPAATGPGKTVWFEPREVADETGPDAGQWDLAELL